MLIISYFFSLDMARSESPIHEYYKKLIQSQPIQIHKKTITPNNTPSSISNDSALDLDRKYQNEKNPIAEVLETYNETLEENCELYKQLQNVILDTHAQQSTETLAGRILDVQEDIVQLNLKLRMFLTELQSGEMVMPSEREPRKAMTPEETLQSTLQYIGYYILQDGASL